MPLTTGTRLGPYEVVAAIGAGGMSACGRGERATRVEPLRVGAFSPAPSAVARGACAGGGAPAHLRMLGPRAH